MSKKTIFTGTIGNDKTVDKLRTAFGKINDNFDELYANVSQLNPANISAINDKASAAYVVANAAFGAANTAITDFGVVYTVANAAFDNSNTAFGVVNSAYASINANWTNQNTIYTVANAAFLRANALVNVGQTAPSSPVVGNLWWDTDVGKLFIYYTDPNGSQWVEVEPSGSGGTITVNNQANWAENNSGKIGRAHV